MCRKQVKLWWIWKEWLLLEALATEDVVIINLDETAWQHHYHGPRGNMIKCIRRGNAVIGARRSFAEKVDTSKTRAHTTLVAMICNDNALQKYLPQILLPGSTTRPCSRAQEALFAGIGAPVETWKDTTGWVNGEIVQRILTRIRAAVRSRRPAAKVLLVIDAACQHIGQDVLRHAARLGLFLLLIPGGLTWLQQPLDVFVFSRFKQQIRDLQQEEMMKTTDGRMPPDRWIVIAGRCIHETIVSKEHRDAFAKLGLQPGRDGLNARLSKYVPPPEESVRRELSNEEVALVMARKRANAAPLFFNGPRRRLESRGAAVAAAHPPAALALPPHARLPPAPKAGPWAGSSSDGRRL